MLTKIKHILSYNGKMMSSLMKVKSLSINQFHNIILDLCKINNTREDLQEAIKNIAKKNNFKISEQYIEDLSEVLLVLHRNHTDYINQKRSVYKNCNSCIITSVAILVAITVGCSFLIDSGYHDMQTANSLADTLNNCADSIYNNNETIIEKNCANYIAYNFDSIIAYDCDDIINSFSSACEDALFKIIGGSIPIGIAGIFNAVVLSITACMIFSVSKKKDLNNLYQNVNNLIKFEKIIGRNHENNPEYFLPVELVDKIRNLVIPSTELQNTILSCFIISDNLKLKKAKVVEIIEDTNESTSLLSSVPSSKVEYPEADEKLSIFKIV